MDDLARNIESVRFRIDDACSRAGRRPDEVTLLAVSKTVALDRVAAAFDLGLRDFGENRPQELARKAPLLPDARWHMIGHLQRNKIGIVLPVAFRIHSVDSLSLLHALDRAAATLDRTVELFLEVNVSREPQKHGFLAEDMEAAVAAGTACQHLRVNGLMTVAADTEDATMLRRQFSILRSLREKHGTAAWELSMGMSHDFELAIEEGATIVRIGSAIFGERTHVA